jgi:hypothetical protein
MVAKNGLLFGHPRGKPTPQLRRAVGSLALRSLEQAHREGRTPTLTEPGDVEWGVQRAACGEHLRQEQLVASLMSMLAAERELGVCCGQVPMPPECDPPGERRGLGGDVGQSQAQVRRQARVLKIEKVAQVGASWREDRLRTRVVLTPAELSR